MSCRCQAHVEKAVSKVPGVESVSVSFADHPMGSRGASSGYRSAVEMIWCSARLKGVTTFCKFSSKPKKALRMQSSYPKGSALL